MTNLRCKLKTKTTKISIYEAIVLYRSSIVWIHKFGTLRLWHVARGPYSCIAAKYSSWLRWHTVWLSSNNFNRVDHVIIALVA